MVQLLDLPPVPKDQPVTGEKLTTILRRITHAFKSPGPAREKVRKVTANTTVLPDDCYLYADTTGGAITITLPLAATMLNARIVVKLIAGANPCNVSRTPPDTLVTGAFFPLVAISTIGDSFMFQSVVDGASGQWHATATFTAASGGASSAVAFVTVANDATLSNERALAAAAGELTLTDGGPNASITVGLAAAGAAGTYTKVTTDAKGRVTSGVAAPLGAGDGGTGQAGGYAVGDMLYASAAATLAKLAAVAAGFILKSAGLTTAPVWGSLITARLAADNSPIAAATPTTGVAVANLQQAVNVNEEWDVEWILYVANSIAADVFVVNVVPTAGTFTGRVRVEGMNGVPTAGAGVVKFLEGPAGTITTATANAPGNTGTIGLVATIKVRAQGKQTVSNGTLTVQLRAGTNAAVSSGTATVKTQSQMIANRIN